MTNHLLTPEEAAAFVRRTPAALANLRYRGVGPKYVKSGKLVRYRVADLEAYLDEHTVEPGVANVG